MGTETGNASAIADDYLKIQKAAVLEADEILFRNIAQLIEYRKKIAIEIINCRDEESNKNLRNIYERSEWHIKQILGL